MEGKQHRTAGGENAPITTYVPPDVRDAFYAIAEAEHRTVAAELRRLVERHVAEYEDLKATA